MGAPIHPVILSGGAGTRLYPLSRPGMPKQFLALTGERTLFQQTALRAARYGAPSVIANSDYRDLVARQLMQTGLSPCIVALEPMKRSTAPAAAVASLLIANGDPSGLVLLLPCDHAMTDEAAFHQAVTRAAQAAQQGFIVTFGIVADRPETGYGYIRKGAALAPAVLRVARFVEKPSREVAADLVKSGDYCWNSGMFLFRADTMLDELQRHAPRVLAAARKAMENARREAGIILLDETAFAASPGVSIDHAVMEKTDRAAIVPCEIGWSDIGSWAALWRFSQTRADLAAVTRPWGRFTSIATGEGFQVKEIVVNPGNRISLQRHSHRREHWTVVAGSARVTRDEEVFALVVNESAEIPLGAKHRLENPGQEPLHVIEVQFGDYLGEDDIERFADDYGRIPPSP
jgi:mannose-1-phosphate guanylyltransferase/mannose-6-phosphate isomerase